jgi:Swt1-like HEPN
MTANNPENFVRLLGMSGLTVRAELRRVEQKHAVSLLQDSGEDDQEDKTYYPQFDASVRAEAAAMSTHYEAFYCLEKSTRQLVTQILREAKGTTWWNDCVPQAVKDEAAKNQQNELDSGVTARSDESIDYITFGQLGEIIRANWANFADTFNSPKALTRVMAQLNTLRGPIAHCSPLAPDEVDRLSLAVKDWFRLME